MRGLQGQSGSFWRGLVSPSVVSVVGAAAFALAEATLLAALATPPRLARLDPSYIALNRMDEYARMTLDALRLKHFPGPGTHVIYVGPSTARLALIDPQKPEPLEAALSEGAGRPVKFHNFTADSLEVEETFTLVDYLPPNLDGIVLFMLSDTRSAQGRKKERLGLDKPMFTTLMAEVSEDEAPAPGEAARDLGYTQDFHTGIHFLDHLSFYAIRRAALTRVHPVAVSKPIVNGRRAPQMTWVRAAQVARSRNTAAVIRQIREVSVFETAVKAHGLDFVVVEAPINPRFELLKPPELREFYATRLGEFLSSRDVPYWNMSEDASLTAADFFDAVHVGTDDARRRWQAVFLRYVIERLREHPAKAP